MIVYFLKFIIFTHKKTLKIGRGLFILIKSLREQEGNMLYKIIRFVRDGTNKVIKRGLTLMQAQEHCKREDTRKEGVWFDGYTEE